jgi:aminomethyltransferase
MTTSDGALKQTALHPEHIRLGARLVPFAGWEMPVQYQSILKEHRAVRRSAGMFDVSHMGEIRIAGAGALDYLQRLTPNDASAIPIGGSQYSCLLQPDGGIIDDIFIYHPDDSFLVVVNASNVQKVVDWLSEQPSEGAEVANVSDETALVAVQGPDAIGAVQTLSEVDLTSLARRGIRQQQIAGIDCLVARTGYTGEDGLELFCSPDVVQRLWTALLGIASVPIEPCGLGARDTLRLEAGNLLYGHEMDETVNPLEAGLGFIVKLDKGDFVGRDALIQTCENGPRQRLVGIEMVDPGIARSDCRIVVDNRAVGRVTSGTYGPTVDRNIGLGYVEPPLATVGQDLDVMIRERAIRARVVKLPFYRSKSRTPNRPV